ncbi:5'-3' exonuclease [Bacillus massilinigeriensis]|uniref:5'-3' exonuclease n=1 Tax=Bacillus mediterraneensis TaxID=1805474 RepID=UPI0008F84CF4|nr:5'-3' exonuclease H3TH domain-containing protein [Bacillus mediterraneensis]
MKENKLMLVDGMALLFRAYYATAVTGQFMFNSKGMPTNGVYGFVKHLISAIAGFQPSHVAVCWDMGSKTFRNDLYPHYKANRKEAPIELIPQFSLARDIVDAFDIPNIGLAGFEADDCIGTISRNAPDSTAVLILTGDKDILQLIDHRISVILLQKGYGNYTVHNRESLYEEKGIWPEQMVDLKAFMGDTSDNYPGVRGIGEKTAIKLLEQYDNVEGVLSNLEALPKGQRMKIKNDLEMLHLSRQLAAIKCDVPVECKIEHAVYNPDSDKILQKFAEIELKGLHRILPAEGMYA